MSTAPAPAPSATRPKPRLRGVSHQIGAIVAAFAGLALVLAAGSPRARTAAAVYAASLVLLLSVSALYHRRFWPPGPRRWMKRLDHSAIYVLIAGTYTPVCLGALPPEAGVRLLWLVWGGAALGVLKSLFWIGAPKPLSAVLYVALGWMVMMEWQGMSDGMGTTGIALMLVGGVLYTLGASVYALRRPDPVPTVFGFHEVFHVFVLLAAACHFVMVARLV